LSGITKDYKIINEEEELGKGAFGEVKKAIDVRTGITRAVKILDKEDFSKAEIL